MIEVTLGKALQVHGKGQRVPNEPRLLSISSKSSMCKLHHFKTFRPAKLSAEHQQVISLDEIWSRRIAS